MRPGYRQTEVGVIPEDWEVVTGEQVTSLITKGASPRWQGFSYSAAGMLFVTSENVRDGYLDLSRPKFLPIEFHEKIIRSRIEKDDVLINLVGASIGRSSLIRRELGEANINQAVAVFRPRGGVDPEFLAFCFQLPSTVARILGMQVEAARPNISLGDLRKFSLPLPPLPEQRVIAEALADVDAAVAGLERLIAKKRDLKQAAMQQLLTGQTRLPDFSGAWEVKRLGEVCKISRGASPRPIDSPIWFDSQSNVGWVRISDLPKAQMFLTATTQKLSSAGIALSRRVPIGGLIVSIAATVGRPAITAIDTCIHDGFVHLSDLAVDKFYMFYLLKSLEPTWSLHGQTGSQMNLNTGIIESATASIPSQHAEQTAIATVLSDMDAELAALQAQLDKTRLIKQAMMQDLLTGRVRLPFQ